MSTIPEKTLGAFPNPHPDRDFVIDYTPDESCVELQALNLYLWS